MTTTREDYASWLDKYLRPRYPELECALLAAIDAFDQAKVAPSFTRPLIQPLIDAARSPRIPLYENATELLRNLAVVHPAAQDAVIEMAGDAQAHVRFNAILCVSTTSPGRFGVGIVQRGLLDRSARVREKAADWASRCKMHELLPDLRRMLSAEPHPGTRACIEYSIGELVRIKRTAQRKARRDRNGPAV